MLFRKQDKVPPPPPKKYTFGRFLGDLGTAVVAAGVASIVWTADKIHDVIN